jgi:hypothetical protein
MQYAYPKLQGTDVTTVKEKFGLMENYLVLVPSNSHYKSSCLEPMMQDLKGSA